MIQIEWFIAWFAGQAAQSYQKSQTFIRPGTDVTPDYISPTVFQWLLPEIVVAAAATLILVLAAFVRGSTVWWWLAGAALVAAAVLLGGQTPRSANLGPVAADSLAIYFRYTTLALGGLFLMVYARASHPAQSGEIVAMLLYMVCGTMLTAGSDELVLLFLGLELVSIPTYILLYLGRHDAASQESTAKYFFLSILSSAVLLYGLSFLYGVTGSTQLTTIAETLRSQAADQASWRLLGGLALVLIFAGLGFRIAAVPFHFYAPDVYQGTTNSNAAMLAVIPKVVGFAALIRVTTLAMPTLETYGWRLALILALLTMTVGNVLALWQDNLRRLFAYSSIANAGYILIGIASAFAVNLQTGTPGALNGVDAAVFFLVVYSLATIGTFAVFSWLGSRQKPVEHVDDLLGVGRTHPISGIMLAVFMFSLAGIPPLAGFWGKFEVFFAALGVREAQDASVAGLGNWFVFLAIAGVLNAAIAAAYYLRIIGKVYFHSPKATPKAEGGSAAFAAAMVAAVLTVVIGIAPGPLLNQADAVLTPVQPDEAAPQAASPAAAPAQPAAHAEQPAAHAEVRPPAELAATLPQR